MRLALFIEHAQQQIVAEAIAFSRTLKTFTNVDERQIRQHLPKLLQTISRDLHAERSTAASFAESRSVTTAQRYSNAAENHGLQHAQLGLSIEQLLLEYRALRASVLRLWGEQHAPDGYTVGDVGRFNEAIDQALAESVRTFVAETESRKQIFLAALGHELRGPLNAVVLTTDALVFDGPPELRLYTDVLARSTRRMTRLLASLLDYNLVGLGGHMELHCSELDLGQECNEELQILSAAFPTARIEVTLEGSLCGKFDASRVRKALANLVSNAVQHGVASHLVQVELRGTPDAVAITVSNAIEDDIPASELDLLFEPTRRRALKPQMTQRNHLGLGLFITREIARAHGGDIAAVCDRQSISFTVHLPKSGRSK